MRNIVDVPDIESDSDSEPDIGRSDTMSSQVNITRSRGFENLAGEGEISENSNLEESQESRNSDVSLINAGTFADDSLDDVGRDVYYSDGESVDSGGSHHEDQVRTLHFPLWEVWGATFWPKANR